MKQLSIKRFLRSTLLLLAVCSFVNVQAQDDLLDYINSIVSKQKRVKKASDSGEIRVIDLSQFNAVVRETTLPITNGIRIRFINGQLSRANSLDGPILRIDASSYVEVGDGATITTQQSSSDRESILMENGELKILSNGAIRGKSNCTSVLMTSDNDVFTMEGGSLYATLVCQASAASITFNGGDLEWNTFDTSHLHFKSASDINVNGKPNNDVIQAELTSINNVINLNSDFIPLFYLKAPAKKDGSVLIKVLHSGEDYLESARQFTHWQGDTKYQIVKDRIARTVKILYDDLFPAVVDNWPYVPQPPYYPCGCVWEDPIPIEVSCEGKKVSNDIEFPDDDLYWELYGRPEGHEDEYDCEGQVDEGEHDIIIRPKAKLRWRWLRWRGCGCQGKHIWVWGTLRIYKVWYYYYWRFIHVMPGGKVVIEDLDGDCDETVFHVEGGEVDYNSGDCTGGQYGWYCLGGEIYIRGGKLTGGSAGGWTGPNGCSYHYGGTVHGGIHNYGIHYLYGGTCTGGGSYTIYNYKGGKFYYYGGTCSDGGKIWNEGDLYIDGGSSDINCGDIFCVRGCHIYILRKLIFNIRLIFTKENIILNEPIVLGGNGYRLTAEDCEKIQITLPQGYGWRYDSTSGGIIIYSTSGVSNVEAGQPIVENTFDVTGRKVADSQRGVNIQRMSDGSVRKITVK